MIFFFFVYFELNFYALTSLGYVSIDQMISDLAGVFDRSKCRLMILFAFKISKVAIILYKYIRIKTSFNNSKSVKLKNRYASNQFYFLVIYASSSNYIAFSSEVTASKL